MKKVLFTRMLCQPSLEDLINIKKEIETTFGQIKVITNVTTTKDFKVLVLEDNGQKFVCFKNIR